MKPIRLTQEQKTLRKNVILNTLSHLLYMFAVWLMVLLTPRIGTSADAGVFAIVISVTNICTAIAQYGLMTYIASDINRKFSDTQYFYFSLTTTFISFLLALILCFSFGYHTDGMIWPVFLYFIFVSTDNITSTMNSSMIRIKKNYLFSYALIIKSIVVITLFLASFYTTKNLIISFLIIAVFSVLFLAVVSFPLLKINTKESFKFSKTFYKQSLILLILLLPLLINRLATSNIVSFPKLVLEQSYSKELVGYYGSMSSISTVIQSVIGPMLSQFAPKLAELYKKHKKKEFFKIVIGIIGFVFLITSIAFTCSIFLDKWLLNIIYPRDKGILEYAHFFKWIIAMNGIQAVVALFSVSMVTISELKGLVIVSIIGIISMFTTVYLLVPGYSIMGTIICESISFGVLAIGFIFLLIRKDFSKIFAPNERLGNKDIGIITDYGYWNFGNRLQNYALRKKINELDYNTINICFRRFYGYPFGTIIEKLILIKKKRFYKKNRLIKEAAYESGENNLFFSYTKNSKENIKLVKKIIVGSDQVWNWTYHKYDLSMNLGLFACEWNGSISSYAASIGIDYINEDLIPIFKEGLSKFKTISVREENAKNLLKNIGFNANLVCDPTLLLSPEEWETAISLYSRIKAPNEPYILKYCISESINYNSEQKIIDLLNRKDKFYNINHFDFIKLITKADLIVTDSYHAFIFSIIFKKKILLCNRKNMNSRFDYLFNLLGINRAFNKVVDLSIVNNNKINKFISKSYNYLENVLKGNKFNNKSS